MKKFMVLPSLASLLLSAACGEVLPETCAQGTIERAYMCPEQAELYCLTMQDTPQWDTCMAVYESLCYPGGDPVGEDVCLTQHQACLQALGPVSMGQGSGTGGAGFVPLECRESWE